MVIKKDKVVSLSYQLRNKSEVGEVIETVQKESPLTFLFGAGNLLPKFEENLEGLKVGESFAFGLKAADAYGDINNKAVVDIPISAFQIDGKLDNEMLKVGNQIPMQDSAGNRLNGIVKNVTESAVTMDFNHPLAGTDLHFSGEVTEIREATEEELSHGHIHAGCSCGDNCGDGCGDGCC